MPKAAIAETAISHDYLLSLLEYNRYSGVFTWKVQRNSYGGYVRIGALAGTLDISGYRIIIIDGLAYPAHRLAWYYVTKQWPHKQIDHRNMHPDENWFDNLREATMTQQRANQRVRADSLSGVKGVQLKKSGKWAARIRISGKSLHLGTFNNIEDAHAAYATKAKVLFGEFARSS